MSDSTQQHKESFYQAKILRWLKSTYHAAFVWKAAAGPYSQGGIPDICAIIDGHFFGFEVKRPEGGRLTKLQELAIEKINAAGGDCCRGILPRAGRADYSSGGYQLNQSKFPNACEFGGFR